MNSELKEILQSVLKEALEPINHRLDRIEKTMATKSDIDRLEKSVDKAHMESLASDDLILSTLKETNAKLDDREHDLQALNKRIFKVESEIERLTRQ